MSIVPRLRHSAIRMDTFVKDLLPRSVKTRRVGQVKRIVISIKNPSEKDAVLEDNVIDLICQENTEHLFLSITQLLSHLCPTSPGPLLS